MLGGTLQGDVSRRAGLALAAMAVVAASLATSALYTAPAPGSDLQPVAGAEQVVEVLQGQSAVLWTALTGNVTSYLVLGWPETRGEVELGGALVLEQPTDGQAGVIDFGDKPMSIEFTLDG
ncbi:MAG: hypothetical protein ACE5F5_04900 [Acidimicrobiia bacterium]